MGGDPSGLQKSSSSALRDDRVQRLGSGSQVGEGAKGSRGRSERPIDGPASNPLG